MVLETGRWRGHGDKHGNKLEDGEAEVVARFLLSLVMFSLAGLVVKLMSGNTYDFEEKKTSPSQEEHRRLPLQALQP